MVCCRVTHNYTCMSSDTIPLIPGTLNTELWSFPVHVWQSALAKYILYTYYTIRAMTSCLSLYSSLWYDVESDFIISSEETLI